MRVGIVGGCGSQAGRPGLWSVQDTIVPQHETQYVLRTAKSKGYSECKELFGWEELPVSAAACLGAFGC